MTRTGHETEHLDDAPDHADAYALIDDTEMRAAYCPSCAQWVCQCDDWIRPVRHRRPVRPYPSRTITDR